MSGGVRYARAVERAVKMSHIDQDVHLHQEKHADICGSESDVLHTSDVESGTAVQTSLTQEEISKMERKLMQLESKKSPGEEASAVGK